METKPTSAIDALGRVVIPRELRAKLNWRERDNLSFQLVDGNKVILELSESQPNVSETETPA